jgi:hypothetical protein
LPVPRAIAFPLDFEGAILPFAIGSLAAVLLPAPYVWWCCAAQAILGVAYLVPRRRRFQKPFLYLVVHTTILALLVASVIVVRQSAR